MAKVLELKKKPKVELIEKIITQKTKIIRLERELKEKDRDIK